MIVPKIEDIELLRGKDRPKWRVLTSPLRQKIRKENATGRKGVGTESEPRSFFERTGLVRTDAVIVAFFLQAVVDLPSLQYSFQYNTPSARN